MELVAQNNTVDGVGYVALQSVHTQEWRHGLLGLRSEVLKGWQHQWRVVTPFIALSHHAT